MSMDPSFVQGKSSATGGIRVHSDIPLNAHRNVPRGQMGEEGTRPQSNSWPDPISNLPQDETQPMVTEFTTEDAKHMKEDLHRDIPDLLKKQQQNMERLNERHHHLEEAVPEGPLESMAAGERGGNQGPRRKAAEEEGVRLSREMRHHDTRMRGETGASETYDPSSTA